MKLLRFLLVFGITVFIAYFLDHKIPLGEKPIPPLGKILNPFQGLWQSGEGENFQNQTLTHHSLSDDVRIVYDQRKVPHIYASNLEDALFAQGYVEAADRLFQLDFSTRATAGRLSEILGKKMLDYDKERRRFGMTLAAENAVQGWKKHTELFGTIEKYCDGINAYIDGLSPNEYSVEHKLLGIKPEKWTPFRSALFFKSMAEVLCSRETDVASSNSLKYFGKEIFQDLYPEINEKESPIIPKNTKWTFKSLFTEEGDLLEELSYYEDLRTSRPNEGIGSNNWAVDATKSASGYPIFCNDPHLGLSLPSIWYELHIHTPEINAYGVSFPGMPGIMIGFNDDIAWGETNVGHDVMDWYEIKWVDEKKEQYYYDDEKKDIELKIEKFKTREGEVFYDTIRHTVWGPITYEGVDEEYKDLAMRWIAHDEPLQPEFMTFVNALSCKNYKEYLKATEVYSAPAQNFAFASKEGDIALRVNGHLPMKKNQQGRFVSSGDQSMNAWKGFIPRSQNPQVLNPERGFISSANQRSADIDYPYYYNGGFEDYRGRSVNQHLENMENITAEDMKNLQWNSLNIKAQEAYPLMMNLLSDVNKYNHKEILKKLENWDFYYRQDSEAAMVFEFWWQEFYKGTWDEIYEIQDSIKILYPEAWRTIEILRDHPTHQFFDIVSTDMVETATQVCNNSFMKAMDRYKDRVEKNKGVTWGDYRKINIMHNLDVPAFSVMNIVTDGHPSSINATNWSFGPSWRMIVELGESPKAQGIFPGGQSGNPSSPYYKYSIEEWSKGEYHTLEFPHDPDEIEALFEIKMTSNE